MGKAVVLYAEGRGLESRQRLQLICTVQETLRRQCPVKGGGNGQSILSVRHCSQLVVVDCNQKLAMRLLQYHYCKYSS